MLIVEKPVIAGEYQTNTGNMSTIYHSHSYSLSIIPFVEPFSSCHILKEFLLLQYGCFDWPSEAHKIHATKVKISAGIHVTFKGREKFLSYSVSCSSVGITLDQFLHPDIQTIKGSFSQSNLLS